MWDLETGTELVTLRGHTNAVNAVAVTPDGRRAVSGSSDNTLKVWDQESGAELASFTDEGELYACCVCPDGATIIAGGASGRVHFLRLENITPGPAVVTAWQEGASIAHADAPWQRWRRPPTAQSKKASAGSLAFGCMRCRAWSEIPDSALGTEVACPHCGTVVRLNPFVIEADWRPVAAAWKGQP